MLNRKKAPARRVLGSVLLLLGVSVFAVRLIHAGPYAFPSIGPLAGGLGSIALGLVLIWPGTPNRVAWAAMALSPILAFPALYGVMGELEETVSLYATNSDGEPTELRLWVVERDGASWFGMGGDKARAHNLDGTELNMLRRGETRCVALTLHDDRPTVEAMHALKVEKYAVARLAGSVGLYPLHAPATTVALRLDPCTERLSN